MSHGPSVLRKPSMLLKSLKLSCLGGYFANENLILLRGREVSSSALVIAAVECFFYNAVTVRSFLPARDATLLSQERETEQISGIELLQVSH